MANRKVVEEKIKDMVCLIENAGGHSGVASAKDLRSALGDIMAKCELSHVECNRISDRCGITLHGGASLPDKKKALVDKVGSSWVGGVTYLF
jgi:hypothetical protein